MKRLVLVLLLAPGLALPQTGKGVVTGNVTAADGRPAAGVRVAAVSVPEPNGPPVGSILASIAQTDGSGNYRLENVPPGRYYITAGLLDLPTYFPGVTAQAQATIVVVTANATVAKVDFKTMHPQGLHVSGRVNGAPSVVTLFPRSSATANLLNAPVRNGTFEFPNVPPGTYSLQTASAKPVTVVVTDRDVTGIELEFVNADVTVRRQGLDAAWSLDGRWTGVAAEEKTGAIYISGSSGVSEVDLTGKILRSIPSVTGGRTLRLARFNKDGSPALLTFGVWSSDLRAYDTQGRLLWTYPMNMGIDDVWAADLTGDKSDKVIIGFNGSTGLHVLNSNGELLWKIDRSGANPQLTGLGNVWHVSAGELQGDGKLQVVTTSAAGRVHVFSSDGAVRRDLDPGFYANMVRTGRVSEADRTATIFVAGSGANDATTAPLAALSGDGAKKWTLQLESNLRASFNSADLATGKPWMAVGMQGGVVYVIDVERGAVIGSVDGQGLTPEVAWAADKSTGAPLLLVATGSKLNAYRVR